MKPYQGSLLMGVDYEEQNMALGRVFFLAIISLDVFSTRQHMIFTIDKARQKAQKWLESKPE